MKDKSLTRFHRISLRHHLGIFVVIAALLGSTACSSDDRAAAPDGPPVVASEQVSTQDNLGNFLVNPLYVCVQNKTQEPLAFEWSQFMKNTSGNQLDQELLTKTLGPDAFECAVSYSEKGNEHAEFKVQGTKLIVDNSGLSWYMGKGITLGENVDLYINQWNKWPFTGSTAEKRKYVMRGIANDKLRNINKVRAYPIDIQIIEAP